MKILCQGHPIEFSMYINYCRGLRFEEEPDYVYLKQLFKGVFKQKGFKRDSKWTCWFIGKWYNKQKWKQSSSVISQNVGTPCTVYISFQVIFDTFSLCFHTKIYDLYLGISLFIQVLKSIWWQQKDISKLTDLSLVRDIFATFGAKSLQIRGNVSFYHI